MDEITARLNYQSNRIKKKLHTGKHLASVFVNLFEEVSEDIDEYHRIRKEDIQNRRKDNENDVS